MSLPSVLYAKRGGDRRASEEIETSMPLCDDELVASFGWNDIGRNGITPESILPL